MLNPVAEIPESLAVAAAGVIIAIVGVAVFVHAYRRDMSRGYENPDASDALGGLLLLAGGAFIAFAGAFGWLATCSLASAFCP